MTDLNHTPTPKPCVRGKVLYWTPTEIKLLEQQYATLGSLGCRELLPHRSQQAIQMKAQAIGLKGPAVTRQSFKRRWHYTPEIDARIRQAYENPTRGSINTACQATGLPKYILVRRAAMLGFITPRFKQAEWSRKEIELLKEYGHHTPQVIARKLKTAGYSRSVAAVATKLKREDIDRTDPDHYTGGQLARLMGVPSKTISWWINKEGLPATPSGDRSDRQGGHAWKIHRQRLRGWIKDHGQLVDLRKVDRYWFLDLVFNG
jgi:hypothetical protein